MSELKNLKILPQTHARLKAKADRLGMNVYRLADALLHMALSQNDNIIHAAILQLSQDLEDAGKRDAPAPPVTPPVADTTPAAPRRKR